MSQDKHQIDSLVLKSAWQRYAEFDANALSAAKQRKFMRQAALIAALVTVVLAVGSNNYDAYLNLLYTYIPNLQALNAVLIWTGKSLHIILISALILNFLLIGAVIRLQQNENAQELRAAAEEIKKAIYLYRTLLQWHDERDHFLKRRLSDIQRQTAKTFGSDLVLRPYKGDLPPYYDPSDPKSDPGFTHLMPDTYLHYRINHQLEYYGKQIIQPQMARVFLLRSLLIVGLISTLLASIGGVLTALVAIGVFFAVGLMNWLNPREISNQINSYNQLILGLQTVHDHWQSLSAEEKTGGQFFKLVTATEQIIWSQYNRNASELWQAVEVLEGQVTNDILDDVMLLPVAATIFADSHSTLTVNEKDVKVIELEAIVKEVDHQPQEYLEDKEEAVPEKEEPKKEEKTLSLVNDAEVTTSKATSTGHKRKGRPHAFVVMPFGRKQGAEGRWYDFNAIYVDLIRPALEDAGFEAFRADEESVSGDILTDMFQELLLADLVIADMSIDNANVFYELGVRHAMRKRGLVHIQSGRAYMPFDIFNVRTIPYQTDKNGRPDPESLEKDKQTITKITRETWISDIDRVHSPIFNLLDGLIEPDRKTLRTPLATGFWREYNEWRERVSVAQRQKRIGDILVLTEEIRNPLIKEEAIGEAGRALRSMGRFELALDQYRKGLELNPKNVSFRREEAFHLNRLQRTDEAIVKLERLLQDEPDDTEAISSLGRIYKQMWQETWDSIDDPKKRKQEAYEASHWLVKAAYTYLKGYRVDQNEYYPGINALGLAVLMDFLADEFDLHEDPDVIQLREDLPKLTGAIQFVLESVTQKDSTDFWSLASLADLYVYIADDPIRVTRAYKKALTAARKNVFNLRSSLGQLQLLQSIGFRPEHVQAGIDVIKGEINRIIQEEDEESGVSSAPPKVFVFAGHTIDRPGQAESIFPSGMEREVRTEINKALDKFGASGNDIAMTPGVSAGGEIIFIEECLKRDIKVEIHLPFVESRYVDYWISFAGEEWTTRYYAIRTNPDITIRLQIDHIGKLKRGDDPYERNERWTLYSSMIHGTHQMRLILLWDGVVDDIKGGPDNMLAEVRYMGGRYTHLNTTKFNYWKAGGKVSKALDLLADL